MTLNRRTVTAGAAVAGLVVLAALSVPIAVGPSVKHRLLDALGDRFESAVDVESLHVSMLPRPKISGTHLVLHHKNRSGKTLPLITAASFSAEATVFGLMRKQLRLSRVHISGLEINVPPGGMHIDSDSDPDDSDRLGKPSPLVIAELISEDAVLRILRSKPGKTPRVFEIHHLAMEQVGGADPWPFRAELTNPKPPGQIRTHGTFGPWNADDPSNTALAAEYQFSNADLGVFDGIEGILESSGAFKGVLERIVVDGRTSVPAFALSDVKQPVRLETTFHSIVDGTSGDTLLQPVDATFLQTKIHAMGGVVEREGEKGRTVSLDVVMHEARLEDVLRLAVKSREPPMIGALNLTAALAIPPGHRDVVDKLRLDGAFDVASARFTKQQLQMKVNEFSSKARGEPDATPDPVVSNFRGRFRMRDGVIHFSNVTFSMPGAVVEVAGTFAMHSEALDFRGTVRLNARLSQLTTGVRAFFVRLIDGLLRHDHITIIPISIGGTAGQPKVGLDVGRLFKSGGAEPSRPERSPLRH